MKRIAVVYFAYINKDKNWKRIISSQLADLKRSGILSEADLFIEVSDPNNLNSVHCYFDNLKLYCKVAYHCKNTFEYYGLHKVWELSKLDSNYDYVAYFHTKGMSYKKRCSLGLTSGRNPREIVLTYLTFKNYKNTVSVFDTNKGIVKIGAFPKKDDDSSDKSGCFIWFNFFWLRCAYARTLEEPIITDNRFYYENWSTKDIGERGDAYKRLTFSLYSKSNKGYTIHEASDTLKHLNKLYKYLWPLSALYLRATYR